MITIQQNQTFDIFSSTSDIIVYFILVCGFLGLLIYYLILWRRYGHHKITANNITPQYFPPKDLDPTAVRYIFNMDYDVKTFATAILQLAIKGLFKIKEHFTLIKNPTFTASLTEEEQIIADGLFSNGDIFLAQGDGGNAAITKTFKQHRAALQNRYAARYFVINDKYTLIGTIVSLAIVALTVAFNSNLMSTLFFALYFLISFRWHGKAETRLIINIAAALTCGGCVFALLHATPVIAYPIIYVVLVTLLFITNALFRYLLTIPTIEGREVMRHLKGFKWYLENSTQGNAPVHTPDLFEKYLPYALALDAEQEWCKQFTSALLLVNYHPAWSDNAYIPFNPNAFTQSLNAALIAVIAAANVNVR